MPAVQTAHLKVERVCQCAMPSLLWAKATIFEPKMCRHYWQDRIFLNPKWVATIGKIEDMARYQ
jgi:hypothetical protein